MCALPSRAQPTAQLLLSLPQFIHLARARSTTDRTAAAVVLVFVVVVVVRVPNNRARGQPKQKQHAQTTLACTHKRSVAPRFCGIAAAAYVPEPLFAMIRALAAAAAAAEATRLNRILALPERGASAGQWPFTRWRRRRRPFSQSAVARRAPNESAPALPVVGERA